MSSPCVDVHQSVANSWDLQILSIPKWGFLWGKINGWEDTFVVTLILWLIIVRFIHSNISDAFEYYYGEHRTEGI